MPIHGSRVNTHDASSPQEMWERLTPTLRSALSGKWAMFAAYCQLWFTADCRPTTVKITATDLVAKLGGKDARAGRRWLEDLAAIGMIEIVDRNLFTGVYAVYVVEPEEAERPGLRQPDPQSELFDRDASTPSAAVGAHQPPRSPAETDGNERELPPAVRAHEPPRASTAAAVGAHEPPRGGGDQSDELPLFKRVTSKTAKVAAAVGAHEPPGGSPIHGTIDHEHHPPASFLASSLPPTAAPSPSPETMPGQQKLVDSQSHGNDGDANAIAESIFAADAARRERTAELSAWFLKFLNAPAYLLMGGGECHQKRADDMADHLLTVGFPSDELFRIADGLATDIELQKHEPPPPGKAIGNPAAVLTTRINRRLAQLNLPLLPEGKKPQRKDCNAW